MPVYYPRQRAPDQPPTSREINLAIETLRDAGMMDSVMRTLELWNAERLVHASQSVSTNEELSNLFVGLRPVDRKREADEAIAEGAWS